MELFNKLKNPVFYKVDSSATERLRDLESLKDQVPEDLAEDLERDIFLTKAGIAGEEQVRFELENSHIPMYVLHDLYLEHEGLTAQIDYLIITRRHNFVLECKNLVGNIEVNSNGDFIRTYGYGKKVKKEGIYSPITQNRRHLELIRALRAKEKNVIIRAIFEKSFYKSYRGVVVLSNPKTVLNARYAKKEVREQIIRADQLIEYIRKIDKEEKEYTLSDKEMEGMAEYFLSLHKDNKVDYLEKYRVVNKESASNNKIAPKQETPKEIMCPKCGGKMVLRTAAKGANAGKQFYGCSNYPRCRGVVNITG